MKNTGNGTYHSGRKNTDRVKEWRQAHPGYWRKRVRENGSRSQEKHTRFTLESVLAEFALQDTYTALQDSWHPQVVALLGIIGLLRGSALQDIIARDLREIMIAGHAILEALPTKPKTRKRHPICRKSR